MAHSNETEFYKLPQFLAGDKGAWIGDLDPAFLAIDTGMRENNVSSANALAQATQALTQATTAIATANQALTSASMDVLNVDLSITAAPNTPYQTIPKGNTNGNKSILNIFGNTLLTLTNILPTTPLFKIEGLTLKESRELNIFFTVEIVNTSDVVTVTFQNAAIDVNGNVYFQQGLDLSSGFKRAGCYVNTFLCTNGWF